MNLIINCLAASSVVTFPALTYMIRAAVRAEPEKRRTLKLIDTLCHALSAQAASHEWEHSDTRTLQEAFARLRSELRNEATRSDAFRGLLLESAERFGDKEAVVEIKDRVIALLLASVDELRRQISGLESELARERLLKTVESLACVANTL